MDPAASVCQGVRLLSAYKIGDVTELRYITYYHRCLVCAFCFLGFTTVAPE